METHKILDKNTFGSNLEYRTIGKITDFINSLEEKHKNYLGSFICDFNKVMKDLKYTKLLRYTNIFLFETIKKEYLERLKVLENKYDHYFVSHLRNFIVAKLRRTFLDKNIERLN